LRDYSRLDKFIDNLIFDVQEVVEEIPDAWVGTNQKNSRHAFNLFKLIYKKPLVGLNVLDVGHGEGVSTDLFKSEGAVVKGIGLSENDKEHCLGLGHDVEVMDQNFMSFDPNSFDIVWSRHCLEHSIMPYFTLSEYKRVMKNGAYLYIEVPASDTDLNHQNHSNHYSTFSQKTWLALFNKSKLTLIDHAELSLVEPSNQSYMDTYFAFILRKDVQ
jgi:2-polyprenyl-3-methyl-5-hydroxy-6-metoxy-1,4-benzoquinol methylase